MRKTKKEMLMEAVREPKKSMDSILLFLVLLLVVWGLIFLYSTSAYNGRVKFHDPAYYFKKQLFATSLGLIAMYLVSCIDYHIAVKFAPLFYLALGGPVLGWVYKAVNTMDSMAGYKNKKYFWFGRAAARLDDAANFLPSRLSALLMIAAAAVCRLDYRNACRIFKRDRFNHKSPNSAQTESDRKSVV